MSYGVKTSLSVNLGFLFLFAMAVTAFSSLTLVKQVMVKKEVERAWQLAETVSRFGFDSSGKRSMNGLRYAMGHVVKGSAISLVKIDIPDENLVYGFGDDPRLEETHAVMADAMETGEPQLKKLGE
ncbi:MAG: hypothetical protein MI742_10300, partial [Desulfobacterales bacterium]|nr:hypothetical protein [Desulfobacterales bacterium]